MKKVLNKLVTGRLFPKMIFILLVVLTWELTARSGIFPATVFPGFSDVLLSFFEGVKNGLIPIKTAYSLSVIIKGMFLSILIALFLSSLANLSQLAANIVDTLNSILHPLPGIALLPVAILWFGMGEMSLLFIIMHSVIWPMVVNFITGYKAIPRIYTELGQNLGLRGVKLIWGIVLPSSLPYILSGVKIGWARAWRAVIAAEMVFGAAAGTAGGLGWHIYITRYLFDIAGTFAALLAIVIVGIVVEELIFNNIEKATIRKWGMSI